MSSRTRFIYMSALRMKKGELEGLCWLRDDVAKCMIPMLIVPPAKERSSSSQESLFAASASIPDVGGVLSKYWVNRPAFVDSRVLFKEYGADKAVEWLPELFKRARNLGVLATPVASLVTLEAMGTAGFKAAISFSDELMFGLSIQSGDLTDPSLGTRIQTTLADLGLKPSGCALIADFTDADLSDPSLVAPIIRSSLEQLQGLGQWQSIVFLGTHYPEKNPAQPGQTHVQPRNEWLAWIKAVKFDPSTAQQMVFGDFAADSAKIDFKAGRAQPIRHIRYATASNWLVVRGVREGSDYEIMKDVFQRIVESAEFSGKTFSNADTYIFDVAHNNTPKAGNATTWRQVNTTHHITRVVADIAEVRRVPISTLPEAVAGVQQNLLGI